MLHGIVLRSPHAAAKLGAIDTDGGSIASPGVTGNLYRGRPEGRRHRHRCPAPRRCRTATAPTWPIRRIPRWPTARCATSATLWPSSSPRPRTAARDAAELIAVDYDIQPSVTDLAHGTDAGAPLVWPDVKQQHRVRLGDRRQGRDRRAVRQGRARHAADRREQPHRRRLDGGARRDRRLRSGHRPLDAVRQHAGRLADQDPDRRRVQHRARRSSASSRPMSAAASA